MSLHERWAQGVLEGLARMPRGAFLDSTGLNDPPLNHPSIGIITLSGNPAPCPKSACPHRDRPDIAVAGRGEVSIRYSTILNSDAPSVRDPGMRTSPASHTHIADALELVIGRHAYHGIVAIAGGDETLPGVLMAMARLNLPSVLVYGGVIRPGRAAGGTSATACDTVEVETGVLAENASDALEQPCQPRETSCPRQFTASTMGLVAEAFGLTPLGLGRPANTDRLSVARRAGEIVTTMLRDGRPLPRDLITRKGLENACAAVAVTCGSTNAALHLPAIAHEAGLKFTVDDVAAVFRRTLVGAELEPGGRRLVSDLYRLGGVPAVLTKLLESGALHGDALTIHGTELQAALPWIPAASPESRQASAP